MRPNDAPPHTDSSSAAGVRSLLCGTHHKAQYPSDLGCFESQEVVDFGPSSMWRLSARPRPAAVRGRVAAGRSLPSTAPAATLHTSAPAAKRWTTQKGDKVKNWRKHLSKKRLKRERAARAATAALVEAREEAGTTIEMPARTAEEAKLQFQEYGAVAQAVATLRVAPAGSKEGAWPAFR